MLRKSCDGKREAPIGSRAFNRTRPRVTVRVPAQSAHRRGSVIPPHLPCSRHPPAYFYTPPRVSLVRGASSFLSLSAHLAPPSNHPKTPGRSTVTVGREQQKSRNESKLNIRMASTEEPIGTEEVNCGSGGGADTHFGLRVASIFVILVGSTSGALFPVVARRTRFLSVPSAVFE